MKTTLKIAFAGLALLVAILFAVTAYHWYYQMHIGQTLDAQLGFTHGSPYVRCNGSRREVFTIEFIQPGGVFERAGFKSGDIVMGMSITQFYRTLHRGRGGDVAVSVVDGGDRPPLSDRSVRVLRFRVPNEQARKALQRTGAGRA